ncbi:TPA: hypothetical protein DD394_07360 [bacterium UBP9_UBA11836]|nr:hypothetical protein [bacterium UBP9_UBA11836]
MVMVLRFVKIAFLLAVGTLCQVSPAWSSEPSENDLTLVSSEQTAQAQAFAEANSMDSTSSIQSEVQAYAIEDSNASVREASPTEIKLPEAKGNLDSLNSSDKTPSEPSSKPSKGQWKIGGKIELEYSNDKHPTIVNNDTSGSDTLMYETDKLLPQCELNAQYLQDDFKFYTKARYRFDKKKVELLDFYANVPLGKDQKVTLGRFKTRFGIEKSQSSSKSLTCNVSAVTDSLYLGRAWGASFEFANKNGDQLMFGIMNDHNEHRFTSADNDIFARGVKRLSKHSTLGASVLVGQHSLSDSSSLPIQRFGIDYQLKTDNLRLDSEVIYSNGYNGLSEVENRALGGYIGSAYTVNKNVDLVGFIDWYDPNLDMCNQEFYDSDINASIRYVLGVNYYFSRKKERRLMLNYEWKIPTEGPKFEGEGFYMRYSFEF